MKLSSFAFAIVSLYRSTNAIEGFTVRAVPEEHLMPESVDGEIYEPINLTPNDIRAPRRKLTKSDEIETFRPINLTPTHISNGVKDPSRKRRTIEDLEQALSAKLDDRRQLKHENSDEAVYMPSNLTPIDMLDRKEKNKAKDDYVR